MFKISIEGRLIFIVAITIIFGLCISYACSLWINELWLSYLIALLFSLSTGIWLVRLFSKSLTKRVTALHSGMLNLIDNDFSISIANTGNDEVADVIGLYNKVTEKLRIERQHLYQRELLLDTVIQNSSLCLVLTDHNDRVIYSNHDAKKLFNKGHPIQGLFFKDIMQQAPEVLQDVIRQGKDGLFSLGEGDEENSYHISLGRFVLNTQRHNLYLVKQMTKELSRQEAITWKKVIRIISHELNNSLAPISSMAHSGSLMVETGKVENLPKVFATISERSEHLKAFIDSYARLAKLPLPIKSNVEWKPLIEKLNPGFSFEIKSELPSLPGHFDVTQIEQVLMNLLKNAAESGSQKNEIGLTITQNPHYSIIEIVDRGNGMSKKVMENALLPFYTTKSTGSGVGLPLCREIVEAHDGKMSLFNRKNGGLRVRITLPLAR